MVSPINKHNKLQAQLKVTASKIKADFIKRSVINLDALPANTSDDNPRKKIIANKTDIFPLYIESLFILIFLIKFAV